MHACSPIRRWLSLPAIAAIMNAVMITAAWPTLLASFSQRTACERTSTDDTLSSTRGSRDGDLPPTDGLTIGHVLQSPLDRVASRRHALAATEPTGLAAPRLELERRPAQPLHLLAFLFGLHLDPGAE